jgi:RHS repeat-associated protein
VAPFKQGEIASSFGWNQEYLDQDANLTYLQRRFYHVDHKMFLSRDSYYVDNHYMYGKANPITFIDPTGHNARQGLSYSIGAGFAVLGIFGVWLAAPTGGVSLYPLAGFVVAIGTSATLSGMSLIGSQAALDSGNKEAAKALQYSNIGLSAAALAATVAIAPLIDIIAIATVAAGILVAPGFLPAKYPAEDYSDEHDVFPANVFTANKHPLHNGNVEPRHGSSCNRRLQRTKGEAAIAETISQHLTASGESQATVQASVSSVGSMSHAPIAEPTGASATSPPGAAEPDGAIYTRAITIPTNRPVSRASPSSEVATLPIIPGAFATNSSVSADMTGANASFSSSPNAQDVPDLVAPWPGSYGY